MLLKHVSGHWLDRASYHRWTVLKQNLSRKYHFRLHPAAFVSKYKRASLVLPELYQHFCALAKTPKQVWGLPVLHFVVFCLCIYSGDTYLMDLPILRFLSSPKIYHSCFSWSFGLLASLSLLGLFFFIFLFLCFVVSFKNTLKAAYTIHLIWMSVKRLTTVYHSSLDVLRVHSAERFQRNRMSFVLSRFFFALSASEKYAILPSNLFVSIFTYFQQLWWGIHSHHNRLI